MKTMDVNENDEEDKQVCWSLLLLDNIKVCGSEFAELLQTRGFGKVPGTLRNAALKEGWDSSIEE